MVGDSIGNSRRSESVRTYSEERHQLHTGREPISDFLMLSEKFKLINYSSVRLNILAIAF
ncbi:MAG: hypothetical protein CMN21_08615 [Rubinisphaera sp.]|nr:hypothetical protein [Rubinisphaera sp.]